MGHCDIHGEFVDSTLPGCPMCQTGPNFTFHYQYQTPPPLVGTPGLFPGPWFVCPKCGGGFSQWADQIGEGTSPPKVCPWCGLPAGEAPPKDKTFHLNPSESQTGTLSKEMANTFTTTLKVHGDGLSCQDSGCDREHPYRITIVPTGNRHVGVQKPEAKL
jgi:hypothetical protein